MRVNVGNKTNNVNNNFLHLMWWFKILGWTWFLLLRALEVLVQKLNWKLVHVHLKS